MKKWIETYYVSGNIKKRARQYCIHQNKLVKERTYSEKINNVQNKNVTRLEVKIYNRIEQGLFGVDQLGLFVTHVRTYVRTLTRCYEDHTFL